MDRDEGVQNMKREAPESGAQDMKDKTPLLEREVSRRPAKLKPSKTTKTRSHLINFAAVLILFGAVWLTRSAQIYDPIADSRPYAICARNKNVIFTVDAARPTAQCMLVNESGRIADLGSAGEQDLPLIPQSSYPPAI